MVFSTSLIVYRKSVPLGWARPSCRFTVLSCLYSLVGPLALILCEVRHSLQVVVTFRVDLFRITFDLSVCIMLLEWRTVITPQ